MHTRGNTYAHVHSHMHTHMWRHTCPLARAYTCGDTRVHSHMHTHMWRHVSTHTCIHTWRHTCPLTCIHTWQHTCPLTHAYTHVATHVSTRTCIHTDVSTHIRYTHIHTQGRKVALSVACGWCSFSFKLTLVAEKRDSDVSSLCLWEFTLH